jgi:hypothetical protein
MELVHGMRNSPGNGIIDERRRSTQALAPIQRNSVGRVRLAAHSPWRSEAIRLDARRMDLAGEE